MRKHAFEIFVGILVTIGVALVIATGYLAYTSISSIVSSIHEETRPDEKLLLISDLATSLDKAENSVRIYTYTREEKDLRPYQNLLSGIDDQIVKLRETAMGNDRFQQQIDTVGDLIEQKVGVWNDMIALSNTNVANQLLDTISEQLESKIESDSLRKNRSIFKKIFKRQKKQEIQEEKIVKDIEQFREEQQQHVQKLKQKEIKLASTSNQITARLYSLINKLKADEQSDRLAKADEANTLAMETYRWIGWLAVSATLSAIVVIFVIFTYVRRSRASRKALEASKAEAENLAKTKELFVANVSHEIRTPLNVISGFVDQLLKKPLEEGVAGTLRIVKSSTDHLVRIINDILDFSKLQSGKMKLEPVHFFTADLIGEVKLLFENQAKEKQTEFVTKVDEQVPEVLCADIIRLKQIIINLVGNAIKFTKEGTVAIELSVDKKEAADLLIKLVVRDTGIGIDQKNLDKIFEDFTQAESGTSRKYGGTGLGLSIVRKLVSLFEGDIHVESQPGRGTQFICLLSLQEGDKNKVDRFIEGEINVPDYIRNFRFLIVDDEVYNRKLMQAILFKWKVPTDEATDGYEAIEKISSEHFDFILLDVQMPGPDGFEVASHIREKVRKSTGETAIILTTATAVSAEQVADYKKRGIDAYLPKPFTEELLLKTITNIRESGSEKINHTPEVTMAEEKPLLNGSQLLNLDELYRFAGNDKAFVKEMLERFVDSFDAGLVRIKNALANENHEEIGNVAHKMASPCRHIGAATLLENIKKAEQLAEAKTKTIEISAVVEKVQIDYERVKEMIREHIEKIEN